MSSLKEFLEIQRQENEVLKSEIEMQLDNLFNPLNATMQILENNPMKYSNFISKLCQFEQKMNHKLIEINFELKKFRMHHKFPEYHSPTVKTPPENDLDDIEILKANSNELILKLEKLQVENVKETENKVFWDTSAYDKKNIICVNVKEEINVESSNSLIEFESSSIEKKDELCDNLCSNKNCDDFEESDIKAECEIESEEKPVSELLERLKSEKTESGSTHIVEKESVNSSISEDDFLGGECDSDHESLNSEEQINVTEVKVEESTERLPNNSTNLEKIDVKTEYFCEKYELVGYEDTNISNSESELSQFMWKNVIELGMIKPKNFESAEVGDSLLPYQNVILEPCREANICDEKNTESEVVLEKVPTTDIEVFESNNCFEVLPESGYSEIEEIIFSKSEISYGSENQLVDECLPQEEFHKQIKTLENTNVEIPSNKDKKISENINNALDVIEKSDADRTDFSAEEKIKKLGLEDRWTLFERTRKVAALPDLRLKPVEMPVAHSKKLKKKQHGTIQECGISANTQLTEGMTCVFSHVESPAEFYLHPSTEEVMLIDSLNDLITNHYKKTKSPYDSKTEASQSLKQFCCVFLKDLKMYYRAEIVDWLPEDDRLVTVQLVDYGNYQVVHYKNLRPIDYVFTLLPKLATKCYLPLLYPPGSTKTNILTEWPRSSIDALFELSGLGLEKNEAFFRLVHVEIENNEIGVDLAQINESYPNTVGQLLLDLGHAVQIILPEDDPMGILSDEEDIKNFENCHNLNEVILGYDPKDEARICKFSKKDGGRCFKRTCKLEHAPLNRGGYTTDKTLTYCEALNDLKLPKREEYTSIRFTTFVDATKFYGIIMRNMEDLRRLEVIMNDQTNCSKFEKFKVLPARGEIVIVHHWQKRWLRAKVRHHLFNENGECTGAQVFMVDYGDTIDARLENIRKMKKEYLNLPFQAVECEMSGYQKSPLYVRKEMEIFFYQNMVFRFFTARVIASSDMQLCLEFYYQQRLLGDILAEYGFLKEAGRKNIYPHPNSPLIPG